MNVFTETEGLGDAGNLYRSIDKSNVHGLNLTVPESAQGIIKPWEDKDNNAEYAESNPDSDEPEIIIHVPFIENVRVRSILLKLGRGDHTPRRLRVYVNHTDIVDFSEAEQIRPSSDFALREGDIEVTAYPLRGPKFTSVHSLSLFFSQSPNEDPIQVYYVGFRGDVRNPRKAAEQKLEIPAENAAGSEVTDRISEKSGGQQTTAR